MKKTVSLLLCLTVLCGLFLAAQAGTANAAKAGFSLVTYMGSTPTINGQVAAGEWTDCYIDFFYSGTAMTTNLFGVKWDMAAGIDENWVIELVTDTTSDAGDFFQISMDTTQNGGTAPQTDDFLLNYTGHDGTGLRVYRGTGTGWTLWTGYALGTDLVIATSVSASPKSATPHWIIEIDFEKQAAFALGLNNNVRLAAYDASTPGQGVISWPPQTSADNPNDYGVNNSDIAGGSIPEGLTIGLMALLSSFGLIAGSRYFRKRSKP